MEIEMVNIVSLGVVFCLIIILIVFIFAMRIKSIKAKNRKSLGVPIKNLEEKSVYYQCPSPDGLIFLTKNDDVEPKVYALSKVNVEKLPNAFMVVKGGEKIVPWDFVDLYTKKDFDDLPDFRLPEEDDVIELEELAGKQPN